MLSSDDAFVSTHRIWLNTCASVRKQLPQVFGFAGASEQRGIHEFTAFPTDVLVRAALDSRGGEVRRRALRRVFRSNFLSSIRRASNDACMLSTGVAGHPAGECSCPEIVRVQVLLMNTSV